MKLRTLIVKITEVVNVDSDKFVDSNSARTAIAHNIQQMFGGNTQVMVTSITTEPIADCDVHQDEVKKLPVSGNVKSKVYKVSNFREVNKIVEAADAVADKVLAYDCDGTMVDACSLLAMMSLNYSHNVSLVTTCAEFFDLIDLPEVEPNGDS